MIVAWLWFKTNILSIVLHDILGQWPQLRRRSNEIPVSNEITLPIAFPKTQTRKIVADMQPYYNKKNLSIFMLTDKVTHVPLIRVPRSKIDVRVFFRAYRYIFSVTIDIFRFTPSLVSIGSLIINFFVTFFECARFMFWARGPGWNDAKCLL